MIPETLIRKHRTVTRRHHSMPDPGFERRRRAVHYPAAAIINVPAAPNVALSQRLQTWQSLEVVPSSKADATASAVPVRTSISLRS
ncbi:hypothetical protein Bxe_C0441 [Paraburkholderia xenovorans LB400]|uniref:Uncharacterized protein n=1 Tax=Paraburkholderia xenovorans (strain LB400) TaxID=266265 RepID=Q13HU4_PARXL|nr:hypothetical protein Bxe_C0441 [Paraburkholderia xenovorans LB400]